MSNFFKSEVIRKIAAAEDQRAEILHLLRDELSHIKMTGSDVILAVFIEPESKNGIIRADVTLKESLPQSKVGLVVAKGPDAFRFRGSFAWITPFPEEIDPVTKVLTSAYYERAAESTPKIGDWVIHFPTDSRMFGVNGVPCRYSADTTVKMITTKPESIL